MTTVASVRIFVDDLAAATAFYSGVIGEQPAWSGDDASVYAGPPMFVVERADDEARQHGYVGRFTGISFWTTDAAATHSDLTARGVPVHGPPAKQHWGGTLLHVDDPSGNTITFLQDDRPSAAGT